MEIKKYQRDLLLKLLSEPSEIPPAVKLEVLFGLVESGSLVNEYEESYFEHGNGD